jgi:hypothetical protein
LWLSDPTRARSVRWALNLVPFAGIAFLWFISVVRDRIGAFEDRFFSIVFLGSGLLFLASLFAATAVASGLVESYATAAPGADVWNFGRGRHVRRPERLRREDGRRLHDLHSDDLLANWRAGSRCSASCSPSGHSRWSAATSRCCSFPRLGAAGQPVPPVRDPRRAGDG